jgi:ABC-type polysaccharide/polyol phosphate transport system ATPase subunit
MSDTVISVESLSKCYLVGHKSAGQGYKRYTALRDVIGDEVRNFARNAVNIVRGRQVVLGDQVEEFWALKDVSFEVTRGEVLGIIGRNGAGKSTLLKILSRITEPTQGRVALHGRVASLLEVGTGFHPELTGRENIYLNGAILGMTRAEIRRKFDEIVAFAEVEKFLDTPVKRYSSGMYVRLAFAVAAHLEPEILVVDEVLAVGDISFQEKCLRKMRNVSFGEGRTVLFVSHNLEAIQTICNRCIWFDRGIVKADQSPSSVTNSYLEALANPQTNGGGILSVESVRYLGSHNDREGIYYLLEPICFHLTFSSPQDLEGVSCGIGIIDAHDQLIFGINSREVGVPPIDIQFTATLEILMPKQNFLPGRYSLWIQVHDSFGNMLFDERHVSAFHILPPQRDVYTALGAGIVHIDTSWKWT